MLKKIIGGVIAPIILLLTGTAANADSVEFEDVPKGVWYSNAVAWAADEGITLGTSELYFSPYRSCTRAEIATFIWRMAGMPEPAEAIEDAFADIRKGEYYHDAMLWALETGVLIGVADGIAAPNAHCSRAEAVTMLWRYCGAQAAELMYFVDVQEGTYYYDAVAWAIDRYVTDGTDMLEFSPHKVCTRAEIVTMLYRTTRTGDKLLNSTNISSVSVTRMGDGNVQRMTAEELSQFVNILSRAPFYDNPYPVVGDGMTAEPYYLFTVYYADGTQEIIRSGESGATVLYKHTDTYGVSGGGYQSTRPGKEMQELISELFRKSA